MEKLIEAFGKSARPPERLDRIAQGHLLEREDHAVTRALFDTYGASCNFGEGPLLQQVVELTTREHLLPTVVRRNFVFALPGNVGLVAKSTGKEAQEFSTAL